MTTNLYYFKKRVGGIVMAAAMAVALVVPAGVQAGTKATTGWKIAALNSSTTARLYYDGQNLGALTVKSTGSQIISSYNGSKIKCEVSVGKTSTASASKTQYASEITVSYDHKGAAYGRARYVD